MAKFYVTGHRDIAGGTICRALESRPDVMFFRPRSSELDLTDQTHVSAFRQRTGHGIVLNTIFNEKEPVVDTPEQSVACFNRSDIYVLGNKVLMKPFRRKIILGVSDVIGASGTKNGHRKGIGKPKRGWHPMAD